MRDACGENVAGNPADLLQQGIAAARSGQKETARYLLTQAIERDENNVTAWMWLSGVVENLNDKEVCLENVLALDPNNQAAHKGLDWVRQQREAAIYTPPLISESQAQRKSVPLTPAAAILYGKAEPEPEPEPLPPPPVETFTRPRDHWGEPLSQTAQEVMHEFDNELLCPYCAAPTEENDKRCKTCSGRLWTHKRRRPEGSYWFWMLIGNIIINITGGAYLFIVWLTWLFGRLVMEGQIKTVAQFVGVYLGRSTLPSDVTSVILTKLPPVAFWAFVIGMAIQFVQAVLLYLRWRPFYWFMVGFAVLVAFVPLALLAVRPHWAMVAVLTFAATPILLLLRIEEDFMVDYERYWCAPDKGIHSHSQFYQRGREYAREKMWAVAVVHFRRAAAGAPTMLAYHLALVAAYMGLKRYERAEYALREAQRLAPDNPKVQELSNLIAAKTASATNT